MRGKKNVRFSILIIVSVFLFIFTIFRQELTLINNTYGFLIAPVEKFTSSTMKVIEDQLTAIFNKNELLIKNNDYFEQVERMKLEISRLEKLDLENKRLSDLLKTSQKYPTYNTIYSNIIAVYDSTEKGYFIIDKGTNDGIKSNMPVIVNGGLAGRIISSAVNYSKVIPITNPNSAISVMSLRTSDTGILTYDPTQEKNTMIVKYLDVDTTIVEGDLIVTSHISEYFPSKLSVGEVIEVFTSSDGLTAYALLNLTVDFKNLESVLVVLEDFRKDIDWKLGGVY